jgi:hypothetical protein
MVVHYLKTPIETNVIVLEIRGLTICIIMMKWKLKCDFSKTYVTTQENGR